MEKEELIKVLNSLVRYELKYTGSAYMSSQNLEESKFGEIINAEQLAESLGIKFNWSLGFSE